MSRHLNDQYFGGNKLKEVGLPVDGPDAANKTYVDEALAARGVHIYRTLTGTAAATSSPYYCARWDVNDESVTEYRDGMVVCVKVPVAGNGSYGTALQINSLGYKPVVYNVNTMISTRYGVGSVVWAVYNATQTATLYLGSGSQTIIGCWQVMDYNSDTTTVTTVRRYYSARVKPTAVLLSNVIVFRKNETQVVPIHSVAAGTSDTNAYTANNGTNKTMTTEEFDPFGQILWYSNSKKIDANAIIDTGTLYMQYGGLIEARKIFNCGQTLVGNKELYLVVDLQSDGMVKLATDVNPWSQTLPTTNDGHLYILLGITYDTYRFEFLMYHPIYYHDGTQLRMYTGAKQFSGDYNDLTNKPAIGDFLLYHAEPFSTGLDPIDGTYTTYIAQQPNIINDIVAAYNAGKMVVCSLSPGATTGFPSIVVFLSDIVFDYMFTGTFLYDNKLYLVKMFPQRDSNNLPVTQNIGNTTTYIWNVVIFGVTAQNILPAYTGNGGKMLAVNSNADGVEWVEPFSGSYDDLSDKPVNASFGTGIVQASVNNTSSTIAVSFTNYNLVSGGVISVRFTNDVPANAKLNINNKGAKAIQFRGSAITAGVIKAGDRCLFMYNGGNSIYHLLSNDRWGVGV